MSISVVADVVSQTVETGYGGHRCYERRRRSGAGLSSALPDMFHSVDHLPIAQIRLHKHYTVLHLSVIPVQHCNIPHRHVWWSCSIFPKQRFFRLKLVQGLCIFRTIVPVRNTIACECVKRNEYNV